MQAREQTPIVFTIAVSQSDWDAKVNGWRCPALKIPSAEVADVFVDGSRVDKACYFVWRENEMIQWSHLPQPKKATISFKLTEALSTQKATDFWKKVAAPRTCIGRPSHCDTLILFVAYFSQLHHG